MTNERPTHGWSDEDLERELSRYEHDARGRGLTPSSVHSYVDYARRFLRWRSGTYVPRGIPLPNQRVGAIVAEAMELGRDVDRYERALVAAGLRPRAIATYVGEAARFVRWIRRDPARPSGLAAPVLRPRIARKGSSKDLGRRQEPGAHETGVVPAALRVLVDQWREAGQPPQPGIFWPRDLWIGAFPTHERALLALPRVLDRAAVRKSCARAAEDSITAEAAFVAAMAWGYGKVGYAVHRVTEILTSTSNASSHLRHAVDVLMAAGALAAYRTLTKESRLFGLGPAFGTKFLYFCQPADQPVRALILDRVVADWLMRHAELKFDPVPWTPQTYDCYLAVMHAWAAVLACRPDQVEELIFRSEAIARGSQFG